MAVQKLLKNVMKLRKYDNVVDAAHGSSIVRSLAGSYVLEVKITPDNRTTKKINKLGLVTFITWSSLYIYCAYVAQSEDQSILRNLYQTKLRRYGDDFERISSFLYVLSSMYFIPFHISCNTSIIEKLLDLDHLIRNAGGLLDYTKIARRCLLIAGIQVCVYLFRMGCIWVPFKEANRIMPAEKIFQVVYSDAQAVIMTTVFCFFLAIVRDRFDWINKTLKDIRDRNHWEYKVYSPGKLTPNTGEVAQIQEKHIREKLKTCAHAYGLLFKICLNINQLFGFILVITLLHYLNYIILYLFYFMEATAASLFNDLRAYVDFLVYVFWEIAIAFGVIFLIIYVCETVMAKAKHTAFIVHEIITGDLSADINIEAMQFSVQLLHEKPVFSVLGLFRLDYALLDQGARSVFTYLVILLQFVTENGHKENMLN